MRVMNDYIADHRTRMITYLDMISVCRRFVCHSCNPSLVCKIRTKYCLPCRLQTAPKEGPAGQAATVTIDVPKKMSRLFTYFLAATPKVY